MDKGETHNVCRHAAPKTCAYVQHQLSASRTAAYNDEGGLGPWTPLHISQPHCEPLDVVQRFGENSVSC
ncbi:MAG: hypothetical protein M3511_13355, partial [Deinococcota bacterium]|nr:hypothetical protein [Deinococcota bacterium]